MSHVSCLMSHALFIHPPFLVEGNTKGMRHNQISWCTDAFEDDFWGHLCSIGSNSKNDGEAPLFCSARFYCHCSAPTELQCSVRWQLKMHGCLHPCCRCEIKVSRRVVWLQWRSHETAQCSLQDRRAIAGPELFWFACWVASFAFLVPSTGSFESRIIGELFSFKAKDQSTHRNTYEK